MQKTSISLPIYSPDSDIQSYLSEIKKFPILSAEEEYMLAKRWCDYEDYSAAHKLVTSHLRLVVKIAKSYRGYGLPIVDLIAEGNIGMMEAVKKFNPDLGYRLSTYAMWWIKAMIQEHVLRSWSLVKLGSTAAQKKLFFNLRKIKKQITGGERNLNHSDTELIASKLNVKQSEVIDMDGRMSGSDQSLNEKIGDENGTERIEIVESGEDNVSDIMVRNQDYNVKKYILSEAMKKLNSRELDILQTRKLSDNPMTLENLSVKYNISRERVRQIEARAIEKIKFLSLEMYNFSKLPKPETTH